MIKPHNRLVGAHCETTSEKRVLRDEVENYHLPVFSAQPQRVAHTAHGCDLGLTDREGLQRGRERKEEGRRGEEEWEVGRGGRRREGVESEGGRVGGEGE